MPQGRQVRTYYVPKVGRYLVCTQARQVGTYYVPKVGRYLLCTQARQVGTYNVPRQVVTQYVSRQVPTMCLGRYLQCMYSHESLIFTRFFRTTRGRKKVTNMKVIYQPTQPMGLELPHPPSTHLTPFVITHCCKFVVITATTTEPKCNFRKKQK